MVMERRFHMIVKMGYNLMRVNHKIHTLSALCLFFFLLSFNIGIAQDLKLEEVRKKYPLATTDEVVCNELYNALKGKADGTDILLGYAGGVTMLKAKYTANPFSKLSYFNEGKQLLEDAISNNKNNIELRFLRFAIQENLPAMLNYNDNLEEDKNYIMKYLPMLELRDFKKAIAFYLIKSERTTEQEKAALKKYE